MNSRQKSKEWKIPRHTEFESELRNSSSEWFQKNNFQVHNKMPYCLDSLENWKNNIILAEVAAYIDNFKNESEKKNKPFPLHKYAHHGLSSQAMVFNLIGPLITRNDLNPLTDLLKLKGIDCKINNAHFEYEDRNVFKGPFKCSSLSPLLSSEIIAVIHASSFIANSSISLAKYLSIFIPALCKASWPALIPSNKLKTFI